MGDGQQNLNAKNDAQAGPAVRGRIREDFLDHLVEQIRFYRSLGLHDCPQVIDFAEWVFKRKGRLCPILRPVPAYPIIPEFTDLIRWVDHECFLEDAYVDGAKVGYVVDESITCKRFIISMNDDRRETRKRFMELPAATRLAACYGILGE